MSRVKFNVNSEYAYLQNFKILQSKSFYGSHIASYALQTIRQLPFTN
jgi:hypothetical protein